MLSRIKKGFKSRSITLSASILVYNAIPVAMSLELGFNISFTLFNEPEQSSCWAPYPDIDKTRHLVVSLIQTYLYFALYPLLGWVTDTYIGRRRSMKMSLILCWVGSLLQVASYCIQYGTCGWPTSIAKYGISLVAFLCLMNGTACYQVNVLAYGLDQLFEKSTSQIRSYIHWIVWGQYVGFLTAYIAFLQDTIYHPTLLLITALFIFLFTSVAMVINASFDHKFMSFDLRKHNPYKLVYRVLRYAKKHKSPVNRSAFTYWEANTPSRIDLGMSRYGGPFSSEDVENVKTFLKMVAVFVSTFGFYIPFYIIINGFLSFISDYSNSATDVDGFGSYLYWNSINKIIVIIVPLMELVILPLFPKLDFFMLTPLKGFFVAYILMFMTLLSMLITDTIGRSVTAGDGSFCFLADNDSKSSLNISYFYTAIPCLLGSLANITGLISMLEFICSQSPINMSGMLTGIFYFTRAVNVAVGFYLQLPFRYVKTEVGIITCSFWILIIHMVICVTGFTLFIVVTRWYKGRKRSEEFDLNQTVEDNFEKYLKDNCQEDSGHFFLNSSNEFIQ